MLTGRPTGFAPGACVKTARNHTRFSVAARRGASAKCAL